MYIALRMLLQIDHQRVDMTHGRRCISIEFLVAHQQAERAIIAVEFGGHLLHILQGIVDLSHRHRDIEVAEILGEGIGIVEHIVTLGDP